MGGTLQVPFAKVSSSWASVLHSVSVDYALFLGVFMFHPSVRNSCAGGAGGGLPDSTHVSVANRSYKLWTMLFAEAAMVTATRIALQVFDQERVCDQFTYFVLC